MKLIHISLVLLSGLLVSCGGDRARVSGHIIGAADEPVRLERVVPGDVSIVDTATIDSRGRFSFRVELEDGQPTIFNLRYLDDMVPLLVSPGERVKVMSLGDLGNGYRVDGSPESELVWELHSILTEGAAALDSISGLFATSSPDDTRREVLMRAWRDEYFATKRRHLGFIVGNPSSLAAVYALYQRLPGDETLFNGESDYVYYQMVADSVQRRYPDSRYVAALEKDVVTLMGEANLVNILSEDAITEVDHPDVELPNMYGQKVKLSSLAGKVIVLDFWTATIPASRMNNAEMKELWDSYSEKGLAVYQVSLDTSKPLWVNAVQEQKLPWTTVCDFRGEASPVVGLYNVTSLPANYIIDRGGTIVGKNLYGDDLTAKIEELL